MSQDLTALLQELGWVLLWMGHYRGPRIIARCVRQAVAKTQTEPHILLHAAIRLARQTPVFTPEAEFPPPFSRN